MKKRMLEKYTSRYDKVPSWLMIMLSCFIAFGYVLVGGFLSGIVVGIPMAIVLSFLVLNGNIQFQDINTISYKFPWNLFTWRVRISKSRLFSENPLIYTIPNPFLVYPRWNRGTGDTWLVASDGD